MRSEALPGRLLATVLAAALPTPLYAQGEGQPATAGMRLAPSSIVPAPVDRDYALL